MVIPVKDEEKEWEKQYDSVVEQLGKHFFEAKIDPFLKTVQSLNKLFTQRIQWLIDREPHLDVREINFNLDDTAMKTLNELNQKLNALSKDDKDKIDKNIKVI